MRVLVKLRANRRKLRINAVEYRKAAEEWNLAVHLTMCIRGWTEYVRRSPSNET